MVPSAKKKIKNELSQKSRDKNVIRQIASEIVCVSKQDSIDRLREREREIYRKR